MLVAQVEAVPGQHLRVTHEFTSRLCSPAMASKKAYVDHLRNIPLFQGCSQKDLEKIAKAGDEVTMPAGTLIVDQGQTGREAFVVLSGTVVVKRNGKKVASLGPGTIVGELSLLDHGPRTATVTCETDCTLLLLSQRTFLGVVDDVPDAGAQAAGLAGHPHPRPRPPVLRLIVRAVPART